MSLSDQLLRRLAARAGVGASWRDMEGREHPVSPETQRALLAALGFPCESDDDLRDSLAAFGADAPGQAAHARLVTARVGRPAALPARGEPGTPLELVYEDGERQVVSSVAGACGALALPPPSRPGYHRVCAKAGEFTVATAPARCPRFRDLSGGRAGWGLGAQVYSLSAGVDCGVGDFGGVARLARAAARLGADLVAISPVQALLGVRQRFDSPYSPSSRLFLDPVYADPRLVLPGPLVREAIADAGLGEELSPAARDLVDWPAARRRKASLLDAVFERLKRSGAPQFGEFATYAENAGPALRAHALFEAIREAQGENWDWREWPQKYAGPHAPAAVAFGRERRDALERRIFLQWIAERSYAAAQEQARGAGMCVGLIADIPAGVDPAGGDVWARPGHYIQGAAIGAPPDAFTTAGQNWRLTAFSPHGLAASDFQPFIDLLRANLRHVGGLRLDHAMAVQRLWLIPEGLDAKEGAYVDYPAETLLRLIDLEAWRRGALVIGEDLGTLPAHFSDYLEMHGVTGMRFLRLERDAHGWRAPHRWTAAAAALTATHDTMATAGWWKGAEIPEGPERRKKLEERARDRDLMWRAFVEAGVARGPTAPPEKAIEAVDASVAFVGKTPCDVKLVTLEDAFATEIQVNVPGTRSEKPNWRLRYREDPAERLDEKAVAARLATLVPRGG